MRIEKAEKLIRDTFPKLTISRFEKLGSGKSGFVFLANDEIVFKIPQSNKGRIARWQKNEAGVLRFLEGKLDINIPKVLYEGISKDGLFIIGETLVNGITYSYDLHDSFDEQTKSKIIKQCGKILRNLHDNGGNNSFVQDKEMGETYLQFIKNFDERFSDEVKKVFTKEEVLNIEKIANDYRLISQEHPVKPVLCHFDFHFSNLMFNMKKKEISGLLDFGCAGYAEPARDLHYYFGDGLLLMLEGYGDNGDKHFKERQLFHSLSHKLDNLGDELRDGKQLDSLKLIRKFFIN